MRHFLHVGFLVIENGNVTMCGDLIAPRELLFEKVNPSFNDTIDTPDTFGQSEVREVPTDTSKLPKVVKAITGCTGLLDNGAKALALISQRFQKAILN